MIVAPSILASDFSRLGQEVENVLSAGADWIHIDVMDGKFVPPITFGVPVVQALRKQTQAIFDVHLMIERPEDQVEVFAAAGADIITVHAEATCHLHRLLQRIKDLGKQAGVAINPGTSVTAIESVLELADLILIMTVNPGWGGQKFIESTLAKVKKVRELLDSKKLSAYLEVDGGIDKNTVGMAYKQGARVFVAGTSIFKAANYQEAISELRQFAKQ